MAESAYEPWERQGSLSGSEFLRDRLEAVGRNPIGQASSRKTIDPLKKQESATSSIGPPTPHPQFLGELNDNQIHARIAQLLDELRMLNIALAKREYPSKSGSETSSQLSSPTTPGFRVGRDLWYLPSARKGSVEVYDLGEGRHDSWFGQPASFRERESNILSASGHVDGSNREGHFTVLDGVDDCKAPGKSDA